MATLTQVLANMATFMVYASLKATVLVALVLLAQRSLGRVLSANGRYLLWLPVVISLVTPVGFTTTLPLTGLFNAMDNGSNPLTTSTHEQLPVAAEVPASGLAVLPRTTATALTHTTDSDEISSATSTSYAWRLLLPWCWLAGVLAVLAMVVLASRHCSRLVRQGKPAPAGLDLVLRECLQQTGCKSPVQLLLTTQLQSPLIAGLFRPVLLWPDGLQTQLTPAQVRHVVIHELMHVKRLDILSNWILTLLQAVYWFNPALWLAFACMRHDREMACDAASVQQLEATDRRAYVHTLVKLGTTLPDTVIPAVGLGILDSHSQLRRRVLMLARTPLSRRVQLTFTGLLLLPLAVLAFGQPTPASAPQAQAVAPAEPSVPAVARVQQTPLPVATAAPVATPAPSAVEQTLPVVATPASKAKQVPAATPSIRAFVKHVPTPKPILVAAAPAPVLPQQLAKPASELAGPSSVPAAPAQQPLARTESVEPVCRWLKAPGSQDEQHVCDTAAHWSEFDQHRNPPIAQAAQLLCRDEPQPSSHISRHVCRSAEAWAFIASMQKNKTLEIDRRMNEVGIPGGNTVMIGAAMEYVTNQQPWGPGGPSAQYGQALLSSQPVQPAH